MEDHTITCPNCQEEIPLSAALTHQIEERLRQQVTAEQKEREKQLKEQQAALAMQAKELAETVRAQVAKQVQQEKIVMWNKAQKEARQQLTQEQEIEKKALAESLAEKEQALRGMRQVEIELRRQKSQLEQEKQVMGLENARKLDAERQKIAAEAKGQAAEEYRWQAAEKDKKLQDAIKANEELRRKLEQGSQQAQGEVLELQLEELLRSSFPFDVIEPVPKGVSGADVLQRVHNANGRRCGTIVWELKRTKVWSEKWVTKLKENQRAVKAEIAVLVSDALPKEVVDFEHRDGVWICSYRLIANLTSALRMQILELAAANQLVVGREGKMEVLYRYVTSTEFVHRVQAIVEAFSSMQQDLQKERVIAERQWAKREKQIQQVVNNTAGMYGDLQGLLGVASLQAIPALETGEEEE
jgi:hypothetical protein